MKKVIYNESFTDFHAADYFMEQRLAVHSDMVILEAKLHYINGNWNIGLLFGEQQLELDLDE